MLRKAFLFICCFNLTWVLSQCTRQCPPIEGQYFDIQGVGALAHYYVRAPQAIAPIAAGDQVRFENYAGWRVPFEVTYLAQHSPQQRGGWGQAYALSCLHNGIHGSKTERFARITVISLYDFNDDYLQGDTINALVMAEGLPLDSLVAMQTENIPEPVLFMGIVEKPSRGPEFQVRIVMELNTGEVYTRDTPLVLIR